MADNYLEKKMEEFKAMPVKGVASRSSNKNTPSLSKLIEKNIQYKEFDNKILVRNSHLQELVALAECASQNAQNQDRTPFSFSTHICTNTNFQETETILSHIKEYNPNWINFNNEETLPKAFIIIGERYQPEEKLLGQEYIEMGMVMQSMLLRATEMGLNGSYSIVEDGTVLAHKLDLDFNPVAVIAVGKGKM